MNRTEIELTCGLSDEEVQQRGRALGETVLTIDSLESARTSAMKEYKETLTGLRERQRDLSLAIRMRLEKRMVSCTVEYHAPAQGMKTIVRLDTGEVVREEAMTEAEAEMQLNLFAGEGAPSE